MQIINRDNYETWLMLYLDNELTADERLAVEAFAQAHPDVQEELNGLKEVLLQPELPAAMPGKERLLMPDIWNGEALTRQQEQLLMLADNALPVGEREMLETEIESNSLLKKEWQLISAATLQPEQPAEMPFKEKLFRTESSRVIPIGRILRFAAAAAILAFGWFAIQQMSGSIENAENPPAVASVNAEEKDQVNEPAEKKTDAAVLPDAAETEGNEIDAQIAGSGNTNKGSKVPNQTEKASYEVETALLAAHTLPAAGTEPDINRDLTGKVGSVTYVDVDGVDATTAPLMPNVGYVDVSAVVPEQKQMAAYEVINADEIMEEESISIAGARIPKQKIRSLYRNITRPLARSFEKNQAPRTEVK